jgi:hypothetical protein
VVLLLDHSLTWLQSEGGRANSSNFVVNSWRALAGGIGHFLSQLSPSDRVMIASFEDKVEVLMDWRNVVIGKKQEVQLNPVVRPPQGQKDLYGAIEWSIAKLKGATGRKAVILFTDGRDGRLAPQWFMNDNREEVFDPLFGVPDSGEADEFAALSEAVRASGTRLFFVAVNVNQPPDFRGRPVNGLFPGAKEGIANYAARVRLRMERLAQLSAGVVLYGNRPEDAINAFAGLHTDLFLGARYTIEFPSRRTPEDALLPLQIKVSGDKLRIQFQAFR